MNSRFFSVLLGAVYSVVFLSTCDFFKKDTGPKKDLSFIWIKKEPPHPVWAELKDLRDKRQFKKALDKVRPLIDSSKSETERVRYLIETVRLEIALHGMEKAYALFFKYPWPKERAPKTALDLYFSQVVQKYLSRYRWEIQNREKISEKKKTEIKKWTQGELFELAESKLIELWQDREALGDVSIDVFEEFIEKGNYPASVRGTLRDFVVYELDQIYSDERSWSPEQINSAYLIQVSELLAKPEKRDLVAKHHPILKAQVILDDHELWHTERKNLSGALEARLEKLRTIFYRYDKKSDRKAVRGQLKDYLRGKEGIAWWSMGMYQLARFEEDSEAPDALVRARQIAMRGRNAFPKEMGGIYCAEVIERIEAPRFSLESMRADGLNRPSVLVRHKNVKKLHFRAYAADLKKFLSNRKRYTLWMSVGELREHIKNQKPIAEWVDELPDTPDYREHRSFITPRIKAPGHYVVAVSARADFKKDKNSVQGFSFIATNLVLMRRTLKLGGSEIRVLSGETGAPIAGADVSLYKYDWKNGHRAVETRKSNGKGLVRFRAGKKKGQYFVLAEFGDQIAFIWDTLYFSKVPERTLSNGVLIYADRSVYRPLQKIYWKVLSYSGNLKSGKFKGTRNTSLKVRLIDGNYKEVLSKTVKTNAFGSASGAFTIPKGRALGQWRIRVGSRGSTYFRVEEYKRPTFEVSIHESREELRLNRKATLKGEAKYYFGLPLTQAEVSWRVVRSPRYPWWWSWWGHWYSRGSSGGGEEVVAKGVTEVDRKGQFEVSFTPKADEDLAQTQTSYRYTLTADITDEGGETRSASRGFSLGFVAVSARIEMKKRFASSGKKSLIEITRTSLDGEARKGKGGYKIHRLSQPEEVVLPAEFPRLPGRLRDLVPERKGYRTPGDGKRERWTNDYNWEAQVDSWEAADEVASGDLSHGEEGLAKVSVPALEEGAYRLTYETKDSFGKSFKRHLNFLVTAHLSTLKLPLILRAQKGSYQVGEVARIFVHSGIENQALFYRLYVDGKPIIDQVRGGKNKSRSIVEVPITDSMRGGFAIQVFGVRDHQIFSMRESIHVPWDNKQLELKFSRFRNKMRPGEKVRWEVELRAKGAKKTLKKSAELLAYMYDRSLEAFGAHYASDPSGVYPSRSGFHAFIAGYNRIHASYLLGTGYGEVRNLPDLLKNRLLFYDSYGVGGMGRRGLVRSSHMADIELEELDSAPSSRAIRAKKPKMVRRKENKSPSQKKSDGKMATESGGETQIRKDFRETAFFKPQLLFKKGVAKIQFKVPDSVTSWRVWLVAVTRDFRGGILSAQSESIKDLMIRPYLPRFLREGDQATLKLVVNNATEKAIKGQLKFEILDPKTKKSLAEEFQIPKEERKSFEFMAQSKQSASKSVEIRTPRALSTVRIKVTASSGHFTDGEIRDLPILPSRVRLAQSRFAVLKGKSSRSLEFKDLANAKSDPSLSNESLVVTIDAQLFYSVLSALPYLIQYPYECTEQTLNRFVTTGILSRIYKKFPSIGKMAKKLSKRKTRLEKWKADDPNRLMRLEESPWLELAEGGREPPEKLLNLLKPKIAGEQRSAALGRLKKLQLPNGAFPWFEGGRPSSYITLYVLYGLAKATEFGVKVPKEMVTRGWKFIADFYRKEYQGRLSKNCCYEYLTFLNYVASSYPSPDWMGDALSKAERKKILDHSFKYWKEHSPYLKGMLALTLKRAKRSKDAKLVFDSVMDSSQTDQDYGTYWAPEDSAWLWYNDTIESHAFALRTLSELTPKDKRKEGLVQWLFLNKKLGHWQSTKATAEVMYSLVHYLLKEKLLGTKETIRVAIGPRKKTFSFIPSKYTGKSNQWVIPGAKIIPEKMSKVQVSKKTKGMAFASATWHFSTEKLPKTARGDLLRVERRYYRRSLKGKVWTLDPISARDQIKVGDEVEVHLKIGAKHPSEYIHLRDPRPAGFEPVEQTSAHRYEFGISWYQEIRDSGTNFFLEWFPKGEYTLKYRIRATLSGNFRSGPAVLQSMYAPEFTAYSSGRTISIAQ